MRLTDKISGAAKRPRLSGQDKGRLPMWVRITSVSLALALAVSVALGTPLHSSERGCNMPMAMKGCEHMGMNPGSHMEMEPGSQMEMDPSSHMGMDHSSEIGMDPSSDVETDPSSPSIRSVALCCLIDCQEPGPTGTAFTFKIPAFNGAFLQHVALAPPLTLPKLLPQSTWLQTSAFTPPETYIKNLALLI